IAFQAMSLENNLRAAFDLLNRLPDQSEAVESIGASLLKRMIRAGFEICLDQENRYTNDLYTSWLVFAKYYPGQAALMYQALELAINPVADKKTLSELIYSLAPP